MKIPLDVSIYLRYLHQHGRKTPKELVKLFPNYSQRSIYRHAKKTIGDCREDGRKFNQGRPRLLSPRDSRQLLSSLKRLRRTEQGVFSSVQLQENAGLEQVSNKTVRRELHKHGYGYRQCRKKGQLTERDCQKRLKYARAVKKMALGDDFWTRDIAFYLDGVSFAHKSNPCENAKSARTRTWRKSTEGLHVNCTAKGKKEGTGGKVAKFMVAIAHGKGVVGVHQYYGNISGEKFADYVRSNFPNLFRASDKPDGGYFVQDNDTSQNSRAAKEAFEEVNAKLFAIPARSPDLNPIENVFHLANNEIHKDAKKLKIKKETFTAFSRRCKRTLLQFPRDLIDKTVASMAKRVNMVIASKGRRIKY